MLRYTTLGSKIILGVFFILTALAAYLPFLEAFALTPLLTFVHRFSITLNIGDSTKTLQPIVFVIPILLAKAVFEYSKRHSIIQLLKSKLTQVIVFLTLIDTVAIVTSTDKGASLGILITHWMSLAVFATATIWLALLSEMITKETLKKTAIKLVRTFVIALALFTFVNSFVSITQFIDCSTPTPGTGCTIWKTIDETFPNKLLLVGHQKFSYKPNIIRAPGFFGDVNFNGMYSILIVIIFGTLLITSILLQEKKDYSAKKEKIFYIVTIAAALVSYSLTFSRSALLGAGALGIVLFAVYFLPFAQQLGKMKTIVATTSKFLLITVLVMGILFAAGYAVPLTHNGRTTSLSREMTRYVQNMFNPNEKSAQGHADLFESAIKIGNQRPLIGMGMGTFGVEYERLIRPGGGTNASPHSTYGLLYAEQGIIGVAGYLGVILISWRLAVKSLKNTRQLIIDARKREKRMKRESYLLLMSQLVLALISFGIPFFSVATVTYYGFFLPMTWWWGNKKLLPKG